MARKAGVTDEQIADTAAEMANREGLAAATLGAVAADLGIKTPSLHYRVGGSAGLRRILGLRAAAEMGDRFRACQEDPDPLRSMSHAYRRFARDLPGLYDALLPAPKPDDDPEYFAQQAAPVWLVTDELTKLGVPDDRLVHTVRAIRSALHGFVDNERRGGFGMNEDIDDSFEVLLDLVLPDMG